MKHPKLEKLHILHYPDPRLRNKAEPIPEIDNFLREMGERMAEIMAEERGVGLASTQLGWPYRIITLNTSGEPDKVEAYVNPVIIAKEGKMIAEEGCLSVPNVWAKVRRAERVTVRATRLNGETVEIQAEGLAARAWQHELDHLDGGLFVDRIGPAARIVIASSMKKLERQYKPEPEEEE